MRDTKYPVAPPPIRPAWERLDQRLNVHVRKNQSEEIANLQAATVNWYENFPISDYDSPSSLEEKNTRLEAIQGGIRSVAEKELLKSKKKVIKGYISSVHIPSPCKCSRHTCTVLYASVCYSIIRYHVTHTRRTAR
jgi:hypothetical protein